MKTFSEHRNHLSAVFSTVPQWSDVELLLSFIQDKPGTKVGYGDLMQALDTDDPMRVLAATAILTGGNVPIMKPYFRVKASDGTMHDVSNMTKACLDDEQPYTLAATGEIIRDVSRQAYMAFDISNFHQ